MKNKIIFIVFFSLIANKLFADNLLIEATDIILDKNKETSVFKNNVKIKTQDGKIIESEYAEFNRKKYCHFKTKDNCNRY